MSPARSHGEDYFDKLKSDMKKCKKKYRVSGGSESVWSGVIPDLEAPFSLTAVNDTGTLSVQFVPGGPGSGTWNYQHDCCETGKGSYTISLKDDGSGTMQVSGGMELNTPVVKYSQSITEPLVLTPIDEPANVS